MTVDDLIEKLKKYPKAVRKRHIQIVAPNGILMNPEIKIVLRDKYDVLNHSADNIDYLIICE